MRTYALNLGKIFARPYESDYALIRRFLMANPGIPLSTLKAKLRDDNPHRQSLSGRLHALQPNPVVHEDSDVFHIPNAHQRQCPECAQQLYHTDIYALTWVERCPIHGCEFTPICPTCQQDWPSLAMLSQRECPTCGIPSLYSYRNPISGRKPSSEFQPITDIYHLIIHAEELKSSVLLVNQTPSEYEWKDYWWRHPPITHESYPSFYYEQLPPNLKGRIRKLPVAIQSLKHKSFEINHYCYCEEKLPRYHLTWRYALSTDILDGISEDDMDDFQVMQRIVRWIQHATTHHHPLKISSYRFLSIDDFLNSPDPCPYCLSLSLWFFHIEAQYYGKFIEKRLKNHRLSEHTGVMAWYSGVCPDIMQPTNDLLSLPDKRYAINDLAFLRWFYRRGLEVTYIDILRSVFHFTNQLQQYRRSSHYFDLLHYIRTSLPEQFYSAVLDNDRLTFYYESESPLEDHIPPDLLHTNTREICHDANLYYQPYRHDANNFNIETLSATDFTYEQYKQLHNKFRQFLLKHYGHEIE